MTDTPTAVEYCGERNVGQALRQATDTLARAEVPSPRVDAEILAAHVLGVARSDVFFHHDDAMPKSFDELIARRAAREPLQHLTGTAPVGQLDFAVGPGVFIPRPETELLIEAALDVLSGIKAPVVVDLCAGSGTVGVSIAHARPDARVVVVEKSSVARRWLKVNVQRWAPQVRIVDGDVTDASLLPELHGAVDLVVSNPPYVPTTTPVAPEVASDPADAVFGGLDGMSVIAPMCALINRLLRPEAFAVIEHDDSTQQRVCDALIAAGITGSVRGHRDMAGRDRFVTASKV